MKRLIFAAAMAVSLLGFSLAEEPGELTKLKDDFRKEMAEISAPLLDLDVKYLGHLEKLKKGYQDAGNLDGILAVDEEIKGFQPGEVHESSFAKVKHLQEIYRSERENLFLQRAANAQPVILAYKEKADQLVVTWTKTNQIEDAILAKAESERLAALAKSFKSSAPIPVASPSVPAKGAFSEGSHAGKEMENGIGMKLCWIPAGTTTVRGPNIRRPASPDQIIEMQVELPQGFWMGKREVTQGEYEKVVGTNPSKFQELGRQAPVEQVSWDDAMSFCGRLTELEGGKGNSPDGWIYSLPSQLQWEYACRSGKESPPSEWGLDDEVWYSENSGSKPHEVGKKKPTAWGLHDMRGNVWEWCLDRFGEGTISGGASQNPGPEVDYVIRGNGYSDEAISFEIFRPLGRPQSRKSERLGFRVALVPVKQ